MSTIIWNHKGKIEEGVLWRIWASERVTEQNASKMQVLEARRPEHKTRGSCRLMPRVVLLFCALFHVTLCASVELSEGLLVNQNTRLLLPCSLCFALSGLVFSSPKWTLWWTLDLLVDPSWPSNSWSESGLYALRARYLLSLCSTLLARQRWRQRSETPPQEVGNKQQRNHGTVLRLELDWRITFTLFTGTNNNPTYYHLHAFAMVVIRQFSEGAVKGPKSWWHKEHHTFPRTHQPSTIASLEGNNKTMAASAASAWLTIVYTSN
jgi:hypothetical protein